jgi:hypothetical protein
MMVISVAALEEQVSEHLAVFGVGPVGEREVADLPEILQGIAKIQMSVFPQEVDRYPFKS